MAADKRTRNKHRSRPRQRHHRRSSRSRGRVWRLVRSSASRATISPGIKRVLGMEHVLRRGNRPSPATGSRSRSAFRFWIVTVLRAPKSLPTTSPNKPVGPMPTCHHRRHPPGDLRKRGETKILGDATLLALMLPVLASADLQPHRRLQPEFVRKTALAETAPLLTV